jgi:hypothetical protein
MYCAMRPISKYERGVLDVLLNRVDFPGRIEILEQLSNAQVEEIDPDGSLRFLVYSDSQKVAPVKTRIPVEAEFVDMDGVHGHILLHVLNGKIAELEFYKDDSSHLAIRPNPESLKVMTAGS